MKEFYKTIRTSCTALMVLLVGLLMLAAAQAGYAQTTVSMQTPCPITGCTAQDVTISGVYLADIDGNKIETCSSGTLLNNVYLWMNISKAASKYDLYLQFYLVKDGIRIDNSGDPYTGDNKITIAVTGQISVGANKMFLLPQYYCGQELKMENIYIS